MHRYEYHPKKTLNGARVAWFGIPGRQGGQTHIVDAEGRTYCGHKPSAKAEKQDCGPLRKPDMPECKSCANQVKAIEAAERRDILQPIYAHGLKVQARKRFGTFQKPVRCHSFADVAQTLETLFAGGDVGEVRITPS